MGEDLATQNQRISDNIREYGWHCLHVFPTKEGQDKFSYSIGFGESYGSPEVLIFGLEREKAHALLNECAHLLKGGHIIVPGVEDGSVLAGDYKVVFKSVRPDRFGEYLGPLCGTTKTSPSVRWSCFFRIDSIVSLGIRATTTSRQGSHWPSSNSSFKPNPLRGSA